MRHFIAGAMFTFASAGALPAHAASDITAFSVSATVVASCTIAPARVVRGAPGAGVCVPAVPATTIAAPQPTAVVTHDIANGLDLLTIEF